MQLGLWGDIAWDERRQGFWERTFFDSDLNLCVSSKLLIVHLKIGSLFFLFSARRGSVAFFHDFKEKPP